MTTVDRHGLPGSRRPRLCMIRVVKFIQNIDIFPEAHYSQNLHHTLTKASGSVDEGLVYQEKLFIRSETLAPQQGKKSFRRDSANSCDSEKSVKPRQRKVDRKTSAGKYIFQKDSWVDISQWRNRASTGLLGKGNRLDAIVNFSFSLRTTGPAGPKFSRGCK